MIVIMTYHTLVEKQPDKVSKTWKYSIIIILAIATIASCFVSFSLDKLMRGYDNNCLLNTFVVFDTIVPAYMTTIRRSSTENDTVDETFIDEQKNLLMREAIFNLKQTLRRSYHDDDDVQRDLRFATEHEISVTTAWHLNGECDWPLYLPILFGFISVVWLSFFMMCGHGGGSSGFLPSPWKIVLPATICFTIMAIAALAYMTSIKKGLNEFCSGFEDAMPSLYCSDMLDIFQFDKTLDIPAGQNFNMVSTFIWVLFGSWATVLGIMLLRLMLTVDFELINVKVMKLDQPTAQQLKSRIDGEHPSMKNILQLKTNIHAVDSIVQISPVEEDNLANTLSAEKDDARHTEQESTDEREKFIKDVQFEMVTENVSPFSKHSPSSSVELNIVKN